MLKKIIIVIVVLILLAVSAFLILAPSRIDASLNAVTEHAPYPISNEAKELHSNLLIGDWHADSLLWKRDLNKRHNYSHVDIPRLQAGNVGLQMFTIVTKSPSGLNYNENSADSRDDITALAISQLWPVDTWSSLTARALYQAKKLHNFAQ